MPRLEEQEGDQVARFLDAYEADLAERLTVVAKVFRDDYGGVHLNPTSAAAIHSGWLEHYDELLLWVSDGGRWELPRDMESARFVLEVTEAVIGGRVTEVFGPGRSAVTVVLGSTSVSSSVGQAPRGCLPVPGWTRWGRRVEYAPYPIS